MPKGVARLAVGSHGAVACGAAAVLAAGVGVVELLAGGGGTAGLPEPAKLTNEYRQPSVSITISFNALRFAAFIFTPAAGLPSGFGVPPSGGIFRSLGI